MPMFRATRKFIAVILAIWLPLFSGNALAVSVAMQAMRGDCHSTAAQQDELHCASTMQQHAHHEQLAADQSADHPYQQNQGQQNQGQQNQGQQNQDQQNPAGEDCGTCHLACCGYMAAAPIEVMEAQPAAKLFTLLSTQFRSITSTPLDPPPLARA